MNITISIGTGASPLQGLPTDTFSLRSFSDTDYITAEDGVVLAGSIKHNYRETTGGTLNATTKIPTYPNLILPSSTDAGDVQTGRWTCLVVDSNGQQRAVLFEGYEIPHDSGASITLLQLTIYNDGTTPRRDTTTLTRAQVVALIAESVGLIGTGTQTVAGNKTFTGYTTFTGGTQFEDSNNQFIGDVEFSGAATFLAEAPTTFEDAVDIGGDLNVTGSAVIGADFEVLGNSEVAGEFSSAGVAHFNGGFDADGGISRLSVGANVASAATIVPTGNVFTITGTTTISTINATGITAGTVLFMITTSALTFDEAGNIDVTGATSLTTSAGQLVLAVWDASKWRLR